MSARAGLHSPRQFGSADPSASERGQLLTAEQLAERWQISQAAVYRLARDGAIPFVALGRYRRFRLASIEAWEVAQEAASDV
jgi:excisionase family DNA binding protein